MSWFTHELYGDSERNNVRTNLPGLHNSPWLKDDNRTNVGLQQCSWWNDGCTQVPQQHTSWFRSEQLYGEPKQSYPTRYRDSEASSALQQERMHWENEKKEWMKHVSKVEAELRKSQQEIEEAERTLQEEKTQLLEQYKRVKKLERQGKRREARIENAQQHFQQQANEHFSNVYTTLQLSLNQLRQSSTTICHAEIVSKGPTRRTISSKEPLRLALSLDVANDPQRQRPTAISPSPKHRPISLLKFGRHYNPHGSLLDVTEHPIVNNSVTLPAPPPLSPSKEEKVIDASNVNHPNDTSTFLPVVSLGLSQPQQSTEMSNTISVAQAIQRNDAISMRSSTVAMLKKRKVIDASCVTYPRLNPSITSAASSNTPLLEPPVLTVSLPILSVIPLMKQSSSEVSPCSVLSSVNGNDTCHINVSYIGQEQLLKERKMIDVPCIDHSRLSSSASPSSSLEHYTLLLKTPVPIVSTSVPVVPSIEEQRASEVVNTCSVTLSVDQNDNRYVKSSGICKAQSVKEEKVSDANNTSRRSYHPCRRYRKDAHHLYGISQSLAHVAPPSINGQQTMSSAVNKNDKHIQYSVTCKAQSVKEEKVSDASNSSRRSYHPCRRYRKDVHHLYGIITTSRICRTSVNQWTANYVLCCQWRRQVHSVSCHL